MSTKPKLELTWVGKENRPRLEPRILLEDPAVSYHAPHRMGEGDIFDNRLIHGDNLLALKALEQEFSGQIKCVYIDPPFNTQQAFEHYEDGLEHSVWLGLMRDRLERLYRLLRDDGTLFIHIDDNEIGYLIVLCDEIFGRSNRISIVTFKQGAVTGHKTINPGIVSTSNFILIYAKNKISWSPKKIFTAKTDRDKRYSQFIVNYDENYEGWQFCTLAKAFARNVGCKEKDLKKFFGDEYESKIAEFVFANPERVVRLARPDYGAVSQDARDTIDKSDADKSKVYLLKRPKHSDMYFKGGERILFYSEKLKIIDGELISGEALTSIWDDLLSNNLHNEGGVDFPKGKKPEGLIKRCIELSTEPGDWVLDSFAGSGTTGATAHKMKRRWIMIELRDHCHSHILPRMRRVVDGIDPSGITKAMNWAGGGGFRYLKIAPSLLETDSHSREVISKAYNAEMLAEALCKLEGFAYAPSDSVYWQHGASTERDFLYVTTQTLSQEQLSQLSDEVGPDRSLLVLCSAFRGNPSAFPNLTVKKIPNHVRTRCEWGHDDYSLNVENLPKAPPKPGQQDLFGGNGDGA